MGGTSGVPCYANDPEPSKTIWVRPEAELKKPVAPTKVQELVEKLKRGFDGWEH